MKVVIAGGGIAGNCLLRQLRQRATELHITDLRVYEQRSNASPPGFNVLMNHNGMAALQELDPDLYQALVTVGSPMTNWSAKTVTGHVLYHLENVVDSGDAAVPAMVARWDHIHQATRLGGTDEWTEFSTKVVDVQLDTQTDTLSIQLLRSTPTTDNGNTLEDTEEWIQGVDVLIAADGRYSTIRSKLQPTGTFFGPPHISDYRIVCHGMDDLDDYLTPSQPMWRVYNRPNKDKLLAKYGTDSPAIVAAVSGLVRVGLMKLNDTCLGVFGNIAIPADQSSYDIKNAEFMADLFEPMSGTPDKMGQMVIDMLRKYGSEAHWTRKQETDTCYSALDGRVLFIGDAAGAIYPTLGQGANLSLEDASVAAAAFPNVALIEKLRTPRRDFIRRMSRQHAMHVAFPDTFEQEITNWADPSTEWRANLKCLWACGQQFGLRAQRATADNIRPYGQLIAESLDGDLFDISNNDADLDLSQGTPRFYLMKLTGGRPLHVDRITRHKSVTQCLGALGVNEPFYLVMHAPTDHPTLGGLFAFEIPPRHFIKLHKGTWHVGPLWSGSDDARTFMNLELADTNVVDHDTVLLSSLSPFSSGTGINSDELVIPVLGV